MPSSSTRITNDGGSVSPDSYILKSVKFFNNEEKEIEIKAFVQQIELYEDINHPFLEAIIFIQDATNFYEEQKVMGNEKVTIKIKREPMDETEETVSEFDLTLYIAEVFNFVREQPGKQFYKFRLVSEHLYNNQSKVLQRSFQGSIGKLVKDICDKDLRIKNCVINSDTKDIIKGVYPTIRPIQAINWLLKNAFDNGTPYFFYETLQNGLQFNSLENLYEKDSYQTYEFIPYFKHGTGTAGSYNELRKRVIAFGSELNMGKLNDIGSGAYAATLHTLDVSKKEYKKTFYSYDKQSPKKIAKGKPFSDNTKILDRNLVDLKEGKNYFVNLNANSFPDHKNYHAPSNTTILKSQAHLNLLTYNKHSIGITGDFGLSVGMKVKLDTIKPTTIEDAELPPVMLDKYMGGTYLVTRVVHKFGDTYDMKVDIQRDSVEKE